MRTTMQRHLLSRHVAVVLAGITLFGCAALLAEGERKVKREAASVGGREAASGVAQHLPYTGYGTVDLLDDGTLVVQLGGERFVDEAPEVVPPDEMLFFKLDFRGAALVQHEGVYFVDHSGVQLAERGLRPEQVVRTIFPNPDLLDASQQRYAVLWFDGHLDIRLDVRVPADGVDR